MLTIKVVRHHETELIEVNGSVRTSDCRREGFWGCVAIKLCTINGDEGYTDLRNIDPDKEMPTAYLAFHNAADDSFDFVWLYAGEAAYVMNDQGKTIDKVNYVYKAVLGEKFHSMDGETTLGASLRECFKR